MDREMRPRGDHIGEDTTRTAKHVVLYFHPLIYRNIVLDADTVADADIVAHIDILAKGATGTDTGTPLDVAEVPYLGVVADEDIVVDIAAFVDIRS